QLQIAPIELAPLPWELITIGLSKPWSPALRADYALARVSRGGRPAPPAAVAGPPHLLAGPASGEEIQPHALEAAVAEEVRAGRVELRLMRDATPAMLERALMTSSTHLLHIAAPVELAAPSARAEQSDLIRRATPRLMFRRTPDGRRNGIDTIELTELLAHAADLRLVTLVGPQGDASTVPLALSTPAELLAAEVRATIAFGGPLPARFSACFAAACYSRLAAGDPVDLAATAGRRALAGTSGGRNPDVGRAGWGLVQLRLA